MRPEGRRFAVVLPLFCALMLVASGSPAADFEFGDADWAGTSELLAIARTKLGESRVELVAALDYGALQPADGVLILHPESEVEYEEIAAFLRAGGRVAVLDDFGVGDRLLERFDVKRVPAPLRPAHALRKNPAFAIAVPSVQVVAGEEQGRHPVVANVEQLVTNHPAALLHPNLTPVLEIPAIGEPSAALAVTGIIEKRGRLFAMSDPSVVINSMLAYPGNRAFAQGLVTYLVEDDTWGKRGGKLYLVANRFKQHGQYGGGSSLSESISEYLEGLRDLIGDVRRDGLPDLLALLFGAAAAVGASAWTALLATRTYRRSTPRYAQGAPLVAQGGVAGRAAVLSAPTTHPALAVLELKAALVEGLALRLGLAPPIAQDTLLGEIDRQGALSAPSSRALQELLSEMNRVESAVVASQPLRVNNPQIQRMQRSMAELLREADGARGGRP